MKAFAGTAPVTRASRPDASSRCASSATTTGASWIPLGLLTAAPITGRPSHHDRRRQRGDSHAATLRNLSNRFMGILFHCLQQHVPYDEHQAFPLPKTQTT